MDSTYAGDEVNLTVTVDEIAFERTAIAYYTEVGMLKVETSPPLPNVISLDDIPVATWRLDYLPLAPGVYNVSFGGVTGFMTPGLEVATIVEDAVTTVVGEYS